MSIRLNDDAAYVATLRAGLRRKAGHCPCRLERTAETRCPCKEFRLQMADPDFEGWCHCRLYYKSKD